jgi:steroid delta-isomerase
MATPDEIRATIGQYPERFSANDREGWLDLFAEDATFEDPVGSDVRRSREEIGGFWDFAHSLADAIELRVAKFSVIGHEAAVPLTVISDFGDQRFAIDVIDVMTFSDDARIQTFRAYWDAADGYPFTD